MASIDTYAGRAQPDRATVADMMSIWSPWAQSLMGSPLGGSNGPFDTGAIVQQATAMTAQFIELYGAYIEDLVDAVRQRDLGLASVVSDGAAGIATMIRLQTDPRRAFEEATAQ